MSRAAQCNRNGAGRTVQLLQLLPAPSPPQHQHRLPHTASAFMAPGRCTDHTLHITHGSISMKHSRFRVSNFQPCGTFIPPSQALLAG
jgi:hypothetical protein